MHILVIVWFLAAGAVAAETYPSEPAVIECTGIGCENDRPDRPDRSAPDTRDDNSNDSPDEGDEPAQCEPQ